MKTLYKGLAIIGCAAFFSMLADIGTYFSFNSFMIGCLIVLYICLFIPMAILLCKLVDNV